MKKIAKITGIILACILALMFILPFAFQGKIKEMVIAEGNKMLNAEFGFEGLDISLFKEFPKASVGLEGFWLKGINEFENDTLIYAGDIQVAVNVMSLFADTGFDISKVKLADTKVKAIVLENGCPNWNVMKTDSTTTVEEDSTTTGDFRIRLQQLSVENLNIIYDDSQSNMYADIQGFNATCSGDMTADNTSIDLEALIQALTFKMDGVPFLTKAQITADLNVDADLKNNKFTLKKNSVSLNAIRAGLDGWISMPTDAPLAVDLKLNTSDINFKEILSLIPAIYTKDFETLKAEGTVSLNAFAKGEMQGDSILPQFEANMIVKNGSFRYPALPAGVDAININASVQNPGGIMDATTLAIEQFSLSMLGNTFNVTANVKTPISDPDFNLTTNGTLDLGQIKNVYPLEDMSLNGVVTADMRLGGRLSYIDKEMYDKFDATGNINLGKMLLKMKDMPDISIQKSTFTFSPQFLNLSETTVNIGQNDITANCQFENYMAFVLKGKELKGQLNIHSNHFNLNDFMTSASDTVTATADTTTTTNTEATGVIAVPRNINFNMNVDMAEILFDKISIKNLDGKLVVKDGTVEMENLSMKTMGGDVIMNGSYSTRQNEKQPELNASFAMNNLSFSQTFMELDMVQKLAPIFENLKGDFSGKMHIETKLDSVMSPIFTTTNGNGSLSTKDLNLSGVAVLDKIADATNYSALKNLSVKDMKIDFTIDKGRLNTKPFDIKVSNMNLNLSGSTGLDQSIDYTGKLKLPESAGNIAALSTIDLKIGGTFTAPKISVDTKSMAKQAASVATNKALEKVGEKLGVDLSNAEKQKETLINAAKQAAESLIKEAEKQKENFVSKAGTNALKKLAAEKAGEAIVNEAKKQGERLIEEAEAKGNALIEKAQNGEN